MKGISRRSFSTDQLEPCPIERIRSGRIAQRSALRKAQASPTHVEGNDDRGGHRQVAHSSLRDAGGAKLFASSAATPSLVQVPISPMSVKLPSEAMLYIEMLWEPEFAT